jgi:hypothetical protein
VPLDGITGTWSGTDISLVSRAAGNRLPQFNLPVPTKDRFDEVYSRYDCSWRLTLPRSEPTHYILGHIRQQLKTGNKIDYSVFFVPRRTLVCERVLEEEGVYGDVTIGEFHLDLFMLEDDLWSLELDDSFKELFLVCIMAASTLRWWCKS